LQAYSGLVAPHDHGEERRLLLPAAAHRDSEHGPGDPGLGVRDDLLLEVEAVAVVATFQPMTATA
jgi:hypothetical protein